MIFKNWYFTDPQLLSVTGPDAADFLHRLTTQDIKSMKDGERRLGALLSATSHIQNLFAVDKKPEGFVLTTEKSQLQPLANNLEKMHFGENLTIAPLAVAKDDAVRTDQQRINQGLFVFGKDITEKNLVLEAPLRSFVSRDKGCYPGQEVVERVFTYGQVAKKLVGLVLKAPVQPGQDVTAAGQKVGVITSCSPTGALAMINKSHYEPETRVDQGSVFQLSDQFLPD